MAKQKLCRSYEILDLYITFLEASSPLGEEITLPEGKFFLSIYWRLEIVAVD